MTPRSKVRLNVTKLRELRAEMQAAGKSYVKIGLLGSSANRGQVPLGSEIGPFKPDKLNNPTLGLIHEKGCQSANPPVPRRSFLQIPLEKELTPAIKSVGGKKWENLILTKGIRAALTYLGVMAENVVQKGFATGGYGRWKPLAASTIARKGSTDILMETDQMRRAIHSEVVRR
jgi:hypothetical protein